MRGATVLGVAVTLLVVVARVQTYFAAQIEGLATATAALADGLWLTIDIERIMTHGEAADNADGVCAHAPYGPRATCERWDLEYLGTAESPVFAPWAQDGTRGGDILRGKAQYYRAHGY